MIRLNLPTFDIKLRRVDERIQVLDPLRLRWIALTPEEWVRQHFIHWLTTDLGYPAALMANEVRLRVGQKELRADSVLYDRQKRPRMIIEYKAPSIAITEKVFNQILAYNYILDADYITVSNGLAHYCCKLGKDKEKSLLLDHIPSYEEL